MSTPTTLIATVPRGAPDELVEVLTTTQNSQAQQSRVINTNDVANGSTVLDGTGSVSDALNTLDARKANYLDNVDGPVGLWNFNKTLASAIGGPAFSVGAGTAVGFTEIIPGGFNALTAGPGVRMNLALTPALNLLAAMEVEMILMLEDVDPGMVLVSHGGTGATSASNKAYEFTIPSATYPRNMGFNLENGAGVAQNYATSTAALQQSVPPVHVVMSMGWTRTAGGVRTAYINASQFGAASGALALPTDGSAAFLTLFADALNTNISFSVIASLALYDKVRTDRQRALSYNRSLGGFWGKIPVPP